MATVHTFIGIFLTLCHLAKNAGAFDEFVCECNCVYDTMSRPECRNGNRPETPGPSTERMIFQNIPTCLYNNYYNIPQCDASDDMDGSCKELTGCCWTSDYYYYYYNDDGDLEYTSEKLECTDGPDRMCPADEEGCYLPSAEDCHCIYSYLDATPNDKSQKNYLAIGIGVGIGICVFVALHVALLLYCRFRGRREGKKKYQGPTSPRTGSNRGDDEEYAEIDSYVGDATMRAVANQAYNSSDIVLNSDQSNKAYTSLNNPVINAQYKSLKKPNQDLGDGDYADPEKYTEPPVLPKRNSNVIDEDDDDEDYVSQGTPEPAKENEGSLDYVALKPTNSSGDYVPVDSPAQSSDVKPTTTSGDYVSVDSPAQSSDVESKVPSGDYVSVDSPAQSSDVEPNVPSGDYVSVDSPAQSSDVEPNVPSGDYVSVDSPAQSSDVEPNVPSGDYVSVDSPAQSSDVEPNVPSGDYVSVDSPSQSGDITPKAPDYVSVDSSENDPEENEISSDYITM